jgi:cation diffusion facilitator CzcD-associated flavoprotein CzcO
LSGLGALPANVTTLIVGAGPGGICAGICLAGAGTGDFLIVEKADGVGGTWWHNRYPGAECDVRSHLYSFSFEPKVDWSRPYAGQAEILEYLEHVAVKHDLLRHCRFGCQVASLRWSEPAARWQVVMADGREISARFVISGIGMFNDIVVPDIPGIHDFAGTMFHTARWKDDHEFTGKRIALIGSAASAVQTAPEIAPAVSRLDLYQRTPQWVLPKQDEPFSEDELDHFRTDPDAVRLLREQIYRELEAAVLFQDPQMNADAEAAARANLAQVDDADLRRRLTPDWRYGCRRPLLSNQYYPMFNRPNVHLIDEGIARIVPEGIVTGRGELRPADTIILATGFETTRFLSSLDVTGRDGIHISEAWQTGAIAYRGITTSGFPNLFMLYGPNTNNNSLITMLELQVDYAVRHIRRAVHERLAWLDVKPQAMADYNERLQRDIARITVWGNDCRGYYRAPSGRIVTQCPYTMTMFERILADPDEQNYQSASA